MNFPLFSQNKKSEVIVLYDIGSASVGGALVLLEKEKAPKLLYNVRKKMQFQKKLDFARFTKSMEKTVKDVSLDLQKNGLAHLKFTKFGSVSPKKVYCTLASPWYASQTRIVYIEKKEPFLITKEKINTLVKKEIKDFIEFTKKNKHIKSEDTAIIEQRIMQTKLNGYETSKPFNKKAETLELAIAISVAQKSILKNITDTIHSVFLTPKVEFNSFSFVAFDSLRDILLNVDSFLFMDISGEITDVSLIRKNVVLKTSSFPMGKNNIIREIIKKLGVSEEEATSLIAMYYEKTLEKERHAKLVQIFSELEQKWVSLLQNTLVKLSDTFSIPSSVFFTSDKNMESVFMDLIKKEEFSQFTMTDEIFSVTSVNSAFLNEFILFSKDIERDPFLMLGTIFADKVNRI